MAFFKKILFIVLLIVPMQFFATNFYVNDNDNTNDTFTTGLGVYNGLGTYNNPNSSLQYLLDSLTLGTGDTIFVDVGDYYELIEINADAGVTIKGAGTLTRFEYAGSTAIDRLFVIENTSNITLMDMAIVMTNTFGSSSTLFADNATSLKIDQCYIEAADFTVGTIFTRAIRIQNSDNVIISSSSILNSSEDILDAEALSVENSDFLQMDHTFATNNGINVNESRVVDIHSCSDLTIFSCEILDQTSSTPSSRAMYVLYSPNLFVDSCEIKNGNQSTNSVYLKSGLHVGFSNYPVIKRSRIFSEYAYSATPSLNNQNNHALSVANLDGAEVSNNIIKGHYGFYLSNNASNSTIINNYIFASGYGFYAATNTMGHNSLFVFNSINSKNECLWFDVSDQQVNWSVMNNILKSETYCLQYFGSDKFIESNYNIYSSLNTKFIKRDNTQYNYTQWKNYSHTLNGIDDANSYNQDPNFVNGSLNESYVLLPNAHLDISFGNGLPGVLSGGSGGSAWVVYEDIYGDSRTIPTIGAFEENAGLEGDYTLNPYILNSETNYQDFKSFYDDLLGLPRTDGGPENGPNMKGEVTLTVVNDTVSISGGVIAEYEPPYQLTIQGENGIYSNSTLEKTGNGNLFEFADGATGTAGQNTIFKNLKFITTNSDNAYIEVSNIAVNFKIDSCIFTGNDIAVKIENNQEELAIANSRFINQSLKMVWLNNVVLSAGNYSVQLLNNVFKSENTLQEFLSFNTSSELELFNNMFINNGAVGLGYLLGFNTGNSNVKFFHNSLVNHTNNVGFVRIEDTQTGFEIANNLFVDYSSGGSGFYKLDNVGSTFASIDYNMYAYTGSTKLNNGLTPANNLTDWRAQLTNPEETNSSEPNTLPVFVDPFNDLHITCNTSIIDASNTNGMVTTDFDGEARDYVTPTAVVGADQFVTAALASSYYLTQDLSVVSKLGYVNVYHSLEEFATALKCNGTAAFVELVIAGEEYVNDVFDVSGSITGAGLDIVIKAEDPLSKPLFISNDETNTQIIKTYDFNRHLKIENIKFKASSATVGNLINYQVINNPGFTEPIQLTISSCHFESEATTFTNHFEHALVYVLASGVNMLPLIETDTFIGAAYGLVLDVLNTVESISVDSNYFSNNMLGSLYVNGGGGNVIYKNEISLLAANGEGFGIRQNNTSSTVLWNFISDNKIHASLDPNKQYNGLWIENSEGLDVFNNTISLENGGAVNNIINENSSLSVFISHNSLSISGAATGNSIVITNADATADLDLLNNIISNSALNGYIYSLNGDSYNSAEILSDNMYKSNANVHYFDGNDFDIISDTTMYNPQFSSLTSLKLSQNSPAQLESGNAIQLSTYQYDINGKIRDDPPHKGAYEYKRELYYREATDGEAWENPENWHTNPAVNSALDASGYPPAEGDVVTFDATSTNCNSNPNINISTPITVRKIIYEDQNCTPAIQTSSTGSLSVIEP